MRGSSTGSNKKNRCEDESRLSFLAKNEHQRAFYSEEENPKRGSVFVIYIETESQGQTIFTRTLAPAALKEGEKKPEGPFSRALEEAINYHLSKYSST